MAFQEFTDFDAPKQNGIEYLIAVGRRQPMHKGHLASLNRMMENGYKPIIIIGSTNRGTKENGLSDPLFNPIANPLTPEQQHEQIRIALAGKVEGVDYFVHDMKDLGDNEKWCNELADLLKGRIKIGDRYPDLSEKAAFHFYGKEVDKTARRVVGQNGEEQIVMSYFWEGILDKLGLPVLLDTTISPDFNPLFSATLIRQAPLVEGDLELFEELAAPEYIKGLMHEARAQNGLPDAVPLTMLDLSIRRVVEEKGVSVHELNVAAAQSDHNYGWTGLRSAIRKLNEDPKFQETKTIKIASGAANQTVYDFANNLENIIELINRAVDDGADILSLQELGLTGYGADDYHQWFRNEKVWDTIQFIADYAKEQNPNLVISLGTPWHYANKDLDASDPEYNIQNRPYNCQFTITQGKVVAISAKSILADSPAEYETRQFRHWPFEKGTVAITLPDGSKVPFGKPIVALGDSSEAITLMHEQCAEGWPGINDDLTVTKREQEQARYIAQTAKHTDLSVVLNGSASRPQPKINKEQIRFKLARTGSEHCGAFVYTNYLGNEAGTMAAEGSQIFAQDGQIVHHGERYSFANASYSSAVFAVPVQKRGNVHTKIDHEFKQHEPKFVGKESDFEEAIGDELVFEESARTMALWLRDYVAKQDFACQGTVIGLSGGQDSAMGAIVNSLMVDLQIKESGGVEAFFEKFPRLKYKDKVLQTLREKGVGEAVRELKYNMFTYVYMPSDNSSDTTQNAARALIEGAMIDGVFHEGIGGKFYVGNIQGVFDESIITYSGIDLEKVAREQLRVEGNNDPSKRELEFKKFEIKQIIKEYVDSPLGSSPVLPEYISNACAQEIPTWAKKEDDVTLQNPQARSRFHTWTVANKEGKIALVTSNQSEGVLGYTTAGGDMHMGGANPLAGLPKSRLSDMLLYIQEQGIIGFDSVPVLEFITKQKPTAELRKKVEGQKEQTDEDDLGFSYPQAEILSDLILTKRKIPQEVHEELKGHNLFPADDAERRNIMVKFCRLWGSAQFKRVMGTQGPYMGDNADPHLSLRTTILGDHFKDELAELTLKIASDRLGGADKFKEHFGVSEREARLKVKLNRDFKQKLLWKDLDYITDPANRDEFASLVAAPVRSARTRAA